jgi:hypothetical protein
MELSRILVRLGVEKVRTNSWRGYRGILPRPVPVTTSGDNLDEEVVTENEASQSPSDNVTTCDNLLPFEEKGVRAAVRPVSPLESPLLSTPISSIDKRLSLPQKKSVRTA